MTTVLLTLLVSLLLSVSAGIAADCYVNILTQPGQVLAFWAKWLYTLQTKYAERVVRMGIEKYGSNDPTFSVPVEYAEAESRFGYLLKPILTCVYCVAGQMGFWLSVFNSERFNLAFSLLTAFMAVWMGGAFQAIQKKYFPL